MIAETIARLVDLGYPLKLIGGAALFQIAAESNPKGVPAAFVIPLEETPSKNASGNFVIQRVTVAIGIILVVRNVSDNTGAAASSDMETVRNAVKTQLLGWQPSPAYDPLERSRSALLAFKDGHMWWQDVYISSYIDRSE